MIHSPQMRCVFRPVKSLLLALATATAIGGAGVGPGVVRSTAAPDRIDFNRDVRPLLAEHCFRCHGPDAGTRKRGLRLDTQEGSRSPLRDGGFPVVPHDADASELVRRVLSDDPDEVMPPPAQIPLTEAQREVLRRWVAEGGEYQPHWAFVPPTRVAPTCSTDPAWGHDDIDRFVLYRLTQAGLRPAPEADQTTLLRRASLVLTGISPTPAETDAFLADTEPGAWERQVDRLLASPRYGERMAADWLDVARFADTFGYQSDWECHTWPWRDWVIAAFNANMPWDAFVTEQIAGDLLPGATDQQRLATAFNRLHRQTNEGGSIDEEMRQEYIADRVQTFGSAFLGITVECARCHDHKYDPIPQRDYYSLGAFFGAIDEAGTYPYSTSAIPRPALRLPTDAQRVELTRRAATVRSAESVLAATILKRRDELDRLRAATPNPVVPPAVVTFPLDGSIDGPTGRATAFDGDTGVSLEGAPALRRCDPFSVAFRMRTPTAAARAVLLHTSPFTIESDQQGWQVLLKDGRLSWEIVHFWPGSAAAIRTADPVPVDSWIEVVVTSDGSSRAGGLRIAIDGHAVATEVVRDHLDGPATARILKAGARDRDVGFKGGALDDLRIYDRELTGLEIAAIHGSQSGEGDTEDARRFFAITADPECRAAFAALRAARADHQDLLESVPEVMVMEDAPQPRGRFVLTRGAYDQPDLKRPVRADRALNAILAFDDDWPRDRLGLARWVTDPRNPLTDRVAVNRVWAICFGRGLVGTQENFGVQGDPPSHPELLDALATDFRSNGGDVKGLFRRLVLSATFRQSSIASEESRTRDPNNVLLARGPSARLTAEMLRDQALAASGLLVERLGGPSVKPWQPPGLWEDAGAAAQGTGGYVPDTGESAHRRSLYTFRKRTAPPPNMLLFDAGSREQCLARRQVTNTPLQALALANDPVFFECAQSLAARVAHQTESDPSARITLAFRLLATRQPRPAELHALRSLYDEQVIAFTADTAAAAAVAGDPSATPELAALTLVASTILSSDAASTSR